MAGALKLSTTLASVHPPPATHTHTPAPLHCRPVLGKEQQVGKPLSLTLGRAGC